MNPLAPLDTTGTFYGSVASLLGGQGAATTQQLKGQQAALTKRRNQNLPASNRALQPILPGTATLLNQGGFGGSQF
jgi:hypothetical protein